MIRAFFGGLIFVGVLILGEALFGIDPSWREIALVLVASFVADLITDL